MIINIGRQIGSGGHEVGKRREGALNYKFYDREILQKATEESGISTELFEQADERTLGAQTASWFGSRLNIWGNSGTPFANGLTNESLFQIQSEAIRQLARQGNCIFIGRCADYILRDRTDCLNVFISANKPDRIRRIMKQLHIDQKQAVSLIEKTDKQRAAYYNFYTDMQWGCAESYDLCFNSSTFGIDLIVRILSEWVSRKSQITYS
ncbi:MAG: cytidylate kinase-like family protein [Paludibacteraceae bacterium]|nr:cytidylate kinase-like family protein [Paludibacteraceae bacterium]